MDGSSDDLGNYELSDLPFLDQMDSGIGLMMLDDPTFKVPSSMDFSNVDIFLLQQPDSLVSFTTDHQENPLGFSINAFSNTGPGHHQSMASVGDWNQERKMMDLSPTPVSDTGLKEGENMITRKNSIIGRRRRGRCHEKQVEKPDEVVHVRARRGQATDSHSIAERARREKINERLKQLQDLVPGCYKMMGMTAMLDEIIRYVQSLQNQIEFLSMKLSAADSFHNFCLEMEAMETQATHALRTQMWSGW